jgi:hypothetical protein
MSNWSIFVLACFGAEAVLVIHGCTPSRDVERRPEPTIAAVRSGALPCEVDRILTSTCQKCHTEPPQNGAPFPLVTYADTQVVLDGRPVHEYMSRALESDRMPLAPVRLEQGDRVLLLDWLRAGALPASAGDACGASADAASDSADARTRDVESGTVVAPDADAGSVDVTSDPDASARDADDADIDASQ